MHVFLFDANKQRTIFQIIPVIKHSSIRVFESQSFILQISDSTKIQWSGSNLSFIEFLIRFTQNNSEFNCIPRIPLIRNRIVSDICCQIGAQFRLNAMHWRCATKIRWYIFFSYSDKLLSILSIHYIIYIYIWEWLRQSMPALPQFRLSGGHPKYNNSIGGIDK